MDEIKPAPDSSEAKKQATGNAPLALIIVKEETPEDADARETKSKHKKTEDNLALPPKQMPLRSRIWLWIKRDTKSTDWLIVILTTVIAGTTFLQWREIRSGGQDTHDLAVAAKTQADKMKDMSDAADKIRQAAENMVVQDQRIADNAKASLQATIDISRSDGRAWLYTTGYTLSKEPVENEAVNVKAQVFNSGRTPAVNVTTDSATYVGIGEPPQFNWPKIKSPPSRNIISPNDIRQSIASGGIRLNGPVLALYNSGTVSIYVMFRLDYQDIFGRSHWLTVCTYHSHVMPVDTFNYCRTGNTVDGQKNPN
ncbi:MAG TPA: hypothetical protein VJN89_21725 [Candidatus Acidoferrum sp.]|nr:hypothetical protein [Candidatus Acidoferrum sp.]